MTRGLLIDSHVLMWLAQEPPALSAPVLAVLKDSEAPLFVSAIAIAELCIKANLGKLRLPWQREHGTDDFEELLEHLEIDALPIVLAHATRLRRRPMHHRAPYDGLAVLWT